MNFFLKSIPFFFISFQLFSQNDIDLQAEDGYKVKLRMYSNDPKNLPHINTWIGIGTNHTGMVELLGFSYYKHEKFLLNCKFGSGIISDIDVPIIKGQKEITISQSVAQVGQKIYKAKVPAFKSRTLNLRGGAGYLFPMNAFSAIHVRGGLSFMNGKFANWENLNSLVKRKGGKRVTYNLDLVYYFGHKYTNNYIANEIEHSSIPDEDVMKNLESGKNKIGYDFHIDYYASFWKPNGIYGFRWTFGFGTAPFDSINFVGYGKLALDIAWYK